MESFACVPLIAAPRAVAAVATFSCPAATDTALAAAMGALLPAGLAVLAAAEVRPTFGAVKALERQRYEYILPVSALLAGPPVRARLPGPFWHFPPWPVCKYCFTFCG